MISNELMANIKTDSALTAILSNFETEYIIHIIKDSLDQRFRPYSTQPPTLQSFENNFIIILNNLHDQDQKEQVLEVRQKTYLEIIDVICTYYNLDYSIDQSTQDVYSVAYWLYDFFVCNFTNNLFNFFINYILRDKDYLYDYLNLTDNRKDKDAATNYSKKICSDIKLGLIHANIANVLDCIYSFDITLEDLVLTSLAYNTSLSEFILSVVQDKGNIFKDKFGILLTTSARADIITAIKLKLQEFAGANSELLNPTNIIYKEN